MNHKNLSEVLENIEYTVVKGDVNIQVNDVVYDSRKADKDNAFVCIIGAVTDGHKYIENTLKQGCRVIVIEREIEELPVFEEYQDVTVIKTENTKKALAVMAAAIYDYPDKKLTTIAVTGTKGKTGSGLSMLPSGRI